MTDCSCCKSRCGPCCDTESDAVIAQDANPEDKPNIGYTCDCEGLPQPNLPHKCEQLEYVPAVYDSECQAHGCGNVHPKMPNNCLPIFSPCECGCDSHSTCSSCESTHCHCGTCRHSISSKKHAASPVPIHAKHLHSRSHHQKQQQQQHHHHSHCRHHVQNHRRSVIPLNVHSLVEAKDFIGENVLTYILFHYFIFFIYFFH